MEGKIVIQCRKGDSYRDYCTSSSNIHLSAFKLPNTLCDEMTSMVRRFWWGQANEKKRWHC